jgi:hypothetical protein
VFFHGKLQGIQHVEAPDEEKYYAGGYQPRKNWVAVPCVRHFIVNPRCNEGQNKHDEQASEPPPESGFVFHGELGVHDSEESEAEQNESDDAQPHNGENDVPICRYGVNEPPNDEGEKDGSKYHHKSSASFFAFHVSIHGFG